MSFATMLGRRVGIRTTDREAPADHDRYGNRVHGEPGFHENIRARRDQIDASEDANDRDQQIRTFRYMLELTDVGGEWTVAITGRDVIVDGDAEFKIIGDPELVYRRRRPHHWELTARRIDG